MVSCVSDKRPFQLSRVSWYSEARHWKFIMTFNKIHFCILYFMTKASAISVIYNIYGCIIVFVQLRKLLKLGRETAKSLRVLLDPPPLKGRFANWRDYIDKVSATLKEYSTVAQMWSTTLLPADRCRLRACIQIEMKRVDRRVADRVTRMVH